MQEQMHQKARMVKCLLQNTDKLAFLFFCILKKFKTQENQNQSKDLAVRERA